MLYTDGDIIFSEKDLEELSSFATQFRIGKDCFKPTEKGLYYLEIPLKFKSAFRGSEKYGIKKITIEQMDELIKIKEEQKIKKEKENGKSKGKRNGK